MDIFKLSAVALMGTVLSLSIKKQSPEFSLLIGISTGVLIFFMIASPAMEVLSLLKELGEKAGVKTAYIGIVLKVIGIAYIAQFACEICTDAGERAIASKVELGGKVLIMAVSAPMILSLMRLILNLS